ncbi:MAG TPA: hypothetical protein VKV77_06675 [Methylovirgula sp.]|nr:hypothetical protein [Methylovirgula sp.]
MIAFLTSQPLWLTGLIVVGLTTLIAMCAPVFIRRRVGLENLKLNNEVAGFKFATVGVLYAVFLAFAIILVWQEYSDANANVTKEAGAAATLFHLSRGLDEAPAAKFRDALSAHLKTVIADEWPSMQNGNASRAAAQSLESVYAALLAADTPDLRSSALMAEMFAQLDVLTQARRARLLAAEGLVPEIVWIVLVGGAVLTIGFTFFFGTKNLKAQSVMTGVISLLIFSELLIVVAIDMPFTGSIKVGPEALSEVLADFGTR